MANSGTVTAGSAALASQYNNLRDDVLSITTGHTHTGASENGAKVAATGVSSGTAANGAVLTADGSGAAAFLAAGASAGILKYEEFISSGSFVIPANASSSAIAVVEILGAGNGGQAGELTGVSTSSTGGRGGGGGAYLVHTGLVSALGTAGGTVTVTIGAGGAGGTSSLGNGAFGGATSFGTVVSPSNSFGTAVFSYYHQFPAMDLSGGYPWNTNKFLGANDGGPGTQASTNVTDLGYWQLGGQGGDGGSDPTGGYGGWDSAMIGAGGGGGGNLSSANAAYKGGNGGKRYGIRAGNIATGGFQVTYGYGGAGGSAANGGTAANSAGGGGGGRTSGNGYTGAAGDIGCGGGGGGAARTGNTAGAGGAGGSGRVRVWVIG